MEAAAQRIQAGADNVSVTEQVQDAGVGWSSLIAAVEGSSTLRVLHLFRCGLDAVRVGALVGALRARNSLLDLDLTDNVVGEAGAAAIAGWLREGAHLTSLALCRCGLTDASVAAIADAVREGGKVTKLDIRRNSLADNGTDAIIRLMQGTRVMESLQVDTISRNIPRCVTALVDTLRNNVDTMTALSMRSDSFTVIVMHAERLTELRTADTLLTDIQAGGIFTSIVPIVRRMQPGTRLSIYLTNSVGLTALTFGPLMDVLRASKISGARVVLDLENTGINTQILGTLAIALNAHPTLERLILGHNNPLANSTDAGMIAASLGIVLRTCRSLHTLSLEHLRIGDWGVAATQVLAGAVIASPSLTALNLADNEITVATAPALAAVVGCRTLTTLSLRSNNPENAGKLIFVRAVIDAKSRMTTLYLAYDRGFADAAAYDELVENLANTHVTETGDEEIDERVRVMRNRLVFFAFAGGLGPRQDGPVAEFRRKDGDDAVLWKVARFLYDGDAAP